MVASKLGATSTFWAVLHVCPPRTSSRLFKRWETPSRASAARPCKRRSPTKANVITSRRMPPLPFDAKCMRAYWLITGGRECSSRAQVDPPACSTNCFMLWIAEADRMPGPSVAIFWILDLSSKMSLSASGRLDELVLELLELLEDRDFLSLLLTFLVTFFLVTWSGSSPVPSNSWDNDFFATVLPPILLAFLAFFSESFFLLFFFLLCFFLPLLDGDESTCASRPSCTRSLHASSTLLKGAFSSVPTRFTSHVFSAPSASFLKEER